MDRNNENVIEWVNDDDFVYVTFSQRKFISKLYRLKEMTDGVTILAENDDGSIYAKIPISCIKINPKRNHIMTDEQRAKAADRLRLARMSKH